MRKKVVAIRLVELLSQQLLLHGYLVSHLLILQSASESLKTESSPHLHGRRGLHYVQHIGQSQHFEREAAKLALVMARFVTILILGFTGFGFSAL